MADIGRSAREKIRKLIDDPHPEVGRAATKVLAESGDVEDLDFLIEQMKPGWSAVLAVYPEKMLEHAVKAYDKLGAVMVWYAAESEIAEAVRANNLDG